MTSTRSAQNTCQPCPCRTFSLDSANQWPELSAWLKGRAAPAGNVEATVEEMIARVHNDGDAALFEYTRKFDCPDLKPPLAIDKSSIEAACASVATADMENIRAAAANIREFHEAQKQRSWFMTRPDGTILGQQVSPVDRVGLYVPGGRGGNTPLLSSLLMNAIPAQVAGVRRIAVCTPPRSDGSVNQHILAAAHLLGIDEIYRVGGAWSIAALAHGTESIAPVDVIAGPGNIFVATAKRLVQGQVGIDMIAGPSEVLVIADSSADPACVAADMLSQAEHDPLASAICLTDDCDLATALARELEWQCQKLPKAEIAARSLSDWGAIVKVQNLEMAADVANQVAPEHLELAISEPWLLLPKIRNAGAVFLGHHSPEPVGDYFAGPNHVLPTLGTARFSSALSVETFCKKTSIIATSQEFVKKHGEAIAALARLEDLEAHARSVEIRLCGK